MHATIKTIGTILIFLAFAASRPAYGQNLSTVPTLTQRLETEIQKMIAAGHLRTTFPYGITQNYRRNIFEIPGTTTTVDVQELDDMFHNPADTIYTLASAYPLVSPTLQNSLKTYMQTEYANYQPYRYDHMGTGGAPREFTDVPAEVIGNYALVYSLIASPTTLTGFAGWTFNPFNFYALYKYAQVMGNASTVLSQLAQYNHPAPGPLPPDTFIQPRPHVLNSYIAGYTGYLGLCSMAGSTCTSTSVNTVQGYLTTARSKKIQFLPTTHQEIMTMSAYEAGGFLWLVPELGDYLYNNARTKTITAVSLVEKSVPYWMIPQVEETTQLNPRFNEGSLSHMYETSSLFQAKAYALKLSQPELEQYLHGPGYEKGDLFYIQNLVATLQSTQTLPSPTPSPPTGGKPGDANGDNIVDGRDYIVWLLHYGQNVSGATSGDFDGNNIVDGRDYVVWLLNYGR